MSTDTDPTRADDITVVEFRRYTLHPGRRDELIELFERAFVDPQEDAGMVVLGTFRHVDDPDRFTWFRGFRDMATRRRALETFYGGPVWAAHRDAANVTMIDSDDVHLLHPTGGCSPYDHGGAAPRRFVTVTTPIDAPSQPIDPRWSTVMALESLGTPNDFPRLPVRADAVRVLVLATDHAEAPWPTNTAATEVFRLDPTATSGWR
jgi:hypothetical protein